MTVYFIGGEFDLVKIGFTEGPAEVRLSNLQTGSPVVLSVLADGDGQKSDEADLHRVFQAERAHGEWFRISPRLGRLIAYVKIARSLAGWREALAGDDAPFVYADRFGTIGGFRELNGYPEHYVEWKLRGGSRKYRPCPARWEDLAGVWADSDLVRVSHERNPVADAWYPTETGWLYTRTPWEPFARNGGQAQTADELISAKGDHDREVAIWIQACVKEFCGRDASREGQLVELVPQIDEILSLAKERYVVEWHKLAGHVLPVECWAPDCAKLGPFEFMQLVKFTRLAAYAAARLVVRWRRDLFEARAWETAA